MIKNISKCLAAYKEQLELGELQIAYKALLKYMMSLKASFSSEFDGKYQVGNISPGYMDFTYFPFFNEYLRSEKLRFGIVLNHSALRFELWLMGQNAQIQKQYWTRLKDSPWNQHLQEMPKYSVLETILVASPDFDDLDLLTSDIFKSAKTESEKIWSYIKSQSS
jgi:hypothetical protein